MTTPAPSTQPAAVVTGGSRGIGRAICLRLAREGYAIALVYRSRTEEAEAVRQEIEALGTECLLIQADVSQPDGCTQIFDEATARFSNISVLVNNAGITRDQLLMRMTPEQWNTVIATNLSSVFHLTQLFSRVMMKRRQGSIINITSVVGLMGNAGQSNYAASKAGVIGFTKSMAKELGSRAITVNAVAPGFIHTEMTDQLSPELIARYEALIPLKHLGDPDAVAAAVAFLASPDSRYITGQVLSVDGGMYM